MVNNVILVGRLTAEPEVTELNDGKKVTTINLAVNRNFKNSEGIYETDFIKCVLWNTVAESTSEFCRTGDVIGVKGRLQTSRYDDENGKTHYVMEVAAERVTFLSSNKNKENTEKDER